MKLRGVESACPVEGCKAKIDVPIQVTQNTDPDDPEHYVVVMLRPDVKPVLDHIVTAHNEGKPL